MGLIKEKVLSFFRKFRIKKIISFEASKENFKFLKKKYNNIENVTLENIALSSDISEKNLINVKKAHHLHSVKLI